MKMTENYPQLMESLNDVRRRWRLRNLLEGSLLAFTGVAAVLLVLVAADNLLKLNMVGRSILALLLWGSLAIAVLGLIVRRVLEDRRDDYFAALVEQSHPELHNRLINALQLGRGNQNGHSPRLVAAIVHDAAEATADLDMSGSLDWQRAKWAALSALAAGLFIVAYAVLLWPYFSNGLARLLLPVAEIEPYTATRVAVVHKQSRVPEGNPVVITAEVSGVMPEKVQLHRKDAGGDWQRAVDMLEASAQPKDESRIFQLRIPRATRSFTYYVTAGDGRSTEYTIEVVKRPRIKKLAVSYAPPAYTGLAAYSPRDDDKFDGKVSGIAGTTVTLKITATKPLSKHKKTTLILRKSGQEDVTVPLEQAGSDKVWQAVFVLWTEQARGEDDIPGAKFKLTSEAPGEYFISLRATDGYDNLDPQLHSVTLVEDQLPSVGFTAPQGDVQVKPGQAVPITVTAQDDYGLADVQLWYRINDDKTVHKLKTFEHKGRPERKTVDSFQWVPSTAQGVKPGSRVECWATASDRNNVTGPGRGKSGMFTVTVLTPELIANRLDEKIFDYAEAVEQLLEWQRLNKANTTSGHPFKELIELQVQIRAGTNKLARHMEESALPVGTMVETLDKLYRGLMAAAVATFERGQGASKQDLAVKHRAASVVIQDKIIAELEALLTRLQNNDRARKALRKIKEDKPEDHKKIVKQLKTMIEGLNKLLKDETELIAKFQRMPKKTKDAVDKDKMKLSREMDELQKKWEKWAKGSITELAKLPTGFVDDFKLRKDVNSVYEEIEKAAERAKASKIEVSLEDMGVGLGTKMKEDLETWMPDSPDSVKWVMEEPLNKKTPKVPEMPLPKHLEDLIGDLLQKADEFDEEADDVTSAWGDNLDQAGWGVSDGPISTMSAKGKTGNDMPNSHELSGRSGDGRKGKSSGQMVGDTARNLQGRNTPARVTNERYEPGQLKQESNADPKGSTGGGKKAGAGRKGLQGGSPPDVVKNIGRLTAKQAGLREKAEQVAKKLNAAGFKSSRLQEGIQLFKKSEKDLREHRYKDAARKRKLALRMMKGGRLEIDQASSLHLSRGRNLPPELRTELLQGADDGYPPGYEALYRNYYKELSKGSK